MPSGLSINHLIERLPYRDGGFRRRLIAGVIVVVGCVKVFLDDAIWSYILDNPTFMVIGVAAIYVAGTLIEIVGNTVLVRCASGVIAAASFPRRRFPGHDPKALAFRLIAYFAIVPLLSVINLAKGLIGYSHYEINIPKSLSKNAISFYSTLPDIVKRGLNSPVSDESYFALSFLLNSIKDDKDRIWASRRIADTQDVLTITTAILILIIAWVSSAIPTWIQPASTNAQNQRLSESVYYDKISEISNDKLELCERGTEQLRRDFAVQIANGLDEMCGQFDRVVQAIIGSNVNVPEGLIEDYQIVNILRLHLKKKTMSELKPT